MGNVDNNLLDRIEKTITHLKSKGYKSQSGGVIHRLSVLAKNIEEGTIPSLSDFDLVDFYEPRAILPKCNHLSPLGECWLGLMEYCRHRQEWERGDNTCKKYVERV
jgi:hypothetical protein